MPSHDRRMGRRLRDTSSQRYRQQGADIAHERLQRITSAVGLGPENPPAGRSKIWETQDSPSNRRRLGSQVSAGFHRSADVVCAGLLPIDVSTRLQRLVRWFMTAPVS